MQKLILCLSLLLATIYFCHDYELPIDIDFTDLVGFNFEAHVDLPEVFTEDYIEHSSNCLIAKGEDPYMLVELDVLGFYM